MLELVNYILQKSADKPAGERFMLGIVGFPGAGKSTLACNLVDEINRACANNVKANEEITAAVRKDVAAVVPMDGFHLPNRILDERKLRPLKGIPETFDGEGFVSLLHELRKTPAGRVPVPGFDRTLDEPSPGAIVVEPHHRILVVEGNYLLLRDAPWFQCSTILDEVWFLDVSYDTIRPRLIERHVLGGRTEDGAIEKMESTDLRNARLIEQTKQYATRIISPPQERLLPQGAATEKPAR